MGTSNNELDHVSSPKVSEHETKNGESTVSSPASANEITSSKNMNPSSSSLSHSPSSDSAFEHSSRVDDNEHDKSPQSTTTPSQTHEVEGDDRLDSRYSNDKHESPQSTVTPVEVKDDLGLDSGYSNEKHETPNAELPASTPGAEVPLFTLDSGDGKEKHEIFSAEVPLSALSLELTDSTLELSSNDPMTSPPTQVMERPSESKYRIPSSVFARTKSNNPVDWSVASNESLFSIQMGNMSFIKDDFFLKSEELALKSAEPEMIKSGDLDMLNSGQFGNKSGEVGTPSGEVGNKNGEAEMRNGEPVTPTEPSTSTQMFRYSQTPNTVTTNSGKSAEIGVAVETMKEVIMESADHRSTNSSSEGGNVRNSGGSGSTQFFAFSSGVDNSLRIGSTTKSDAGSLHKAQSQPQSPTKSPKETEEEPKSSAAAPADTTKAGLFSWMSCFPRRLFCCS